MGYARSYTGRGDVLEDKQKSGTIFTMERNPTMKKLAFILFSGLAFMMMMLVLMVDDLGWSIALITAALIVVAMVLSFGATDD